MERSEMNPVVRAIGMVLRLVGISSPEDATPKPKSASDPPSWKDRAAQKVAAQDASKQGDSAPD
jgi:hypothetical protein